MNGKRVLVTGGAGFIGSHLVRKLAPNNEVIVIDDLSTGKIVNIEPLIRNEVITFVQGNIRDRDLLDNIMQGVDYVFHEAAQVNVPQSCKNPLKTNDVNINGTVNVFLAAHSNDVKKVVWASSCAVYGDSDNLPLREDEPPRPLSPYAVTKLAGEYYAQMFTEEYGLPIISLRYFNVYGPRQDAKSDYAAVIPTFIRQLSEKKPPIIYGDGEQTRDFIFVEDVVYANIRAMKKNITGIFNIASGEQISINLLADVINNAMGENINPKHEKPRMGDIRHSVADVSRAKKELNLKLQYSLKEGIQETMERYNE